VSGRRLALWLLALGIGIGAATAGVCVWALNWYHEPIAGLAANTVLEIAPGEPLGAVAEGLARRGLLTHPRLFSFLARRAGKAARIRAGEYALEPGASPAGLIEQFVEGRVVLHPVTLVEGWTIAEALSAIQANPVLKRTLAASLDQSVMARLGSTGLEPEGEFFPDTYLMPRGASDLDVLKLAHARMIDRLTAAWAARRPDLPLATPYEALVLASIIEKETGAPEERPRIAAVFINRLRRGMRLQTDPTVIYGLGEGYDGSLHKRDLVTDTPYNTYTRDGLPPTPIALPGAAALAAAVRPADAEDLYFVATGLGDGRHEFSRTLAEHNAAVARYLQRLRAARGGQR
jgi:UPF0755 protein